MALPIENRQIAYYTSCALTTLMAYAIFCDEQVLNSLHFLTGTSAGFLRTALAGLGPPKGSTRRLQFKLANEGTRPRSNTSATSYRTRSGTPKWRSTGSRTFGGTDDDGGPT